MDVAIFLHLLTVIPALMLGLFILTKRKGTPTHKLIGRLWVVLMLCTSIISFFIQHDGVFSWIHLLSVISISSICIALWGIRTHRIRIHRGFMIGAYIGSIVAGIVALSTPGRFLYDFFASL
ncbi:MAG: DUF2306 domain-containing protein [Arenicella sp.]